MLSKTVTTLDAPAILFVDDDVPNLKVLDVHLRKDFNILTAQNGTDALAILESPAHDVALIVADQRMSGMTGVELLTLVRSRFPDVGRMLITAFADLNPVIDAINAGQISGYIKKPWNPTDIRLLLHNGLERALLERRLRQAEIELLAAERDAVIGFVAGGVGHELNQPTSVLRMNLELLASGIETVGKDGADTAGLDDVKASLSDCLEAVESLSLLSSDLRVLAISQQRKRHAERTDLSVVVKRALRFTEAHLRRLAEVEVELEELPDVRAEESGLTQVVVSLVAHSLQYLEPLASRKHTTMVVRAEMRDGFAVLSLRDNGPGIPAEVQDRLFEPLVLDTQNRPLSRIGLALSKKMVASWGGDIEIRSGEDVGTVYELRLLPFGARLSVVPDAASGGCELPRVLVIDDEPSVLRAVQRILRGNYQVDVADNGRQAVEKLSEADYRAVLCDLQMPLPDGTEIFEQMESAKPYLTARFAFMTGGALSARVSDFLDRVEHEGRVVLHKPFDHRHIRKVVLDLVSKSD